MRYLFLDDKRTPEDVVGYEGIEWTIVKDGHEFENYINLHGVPDVISFDHDLADEHYDIDWDEFYSSKNPGVTYAEDTGLDCLKKLIRRLTMKEPNQETWPKCASHSLNPVGRLEINKLLETWSFPRFGSDI